MVSVGCSEGMVSLDFVRARLTTLLQISKYVLPSMTNAFLALESLENEIKNMPPLTLLLRNFSG